MASMASRMATKILMASINIQMPKMIEATISSATTTMKIIKAAVEANRPKIVPSRVMSFTPF